VGATVSLCGLSVTDGNGGIWNSGTLSVSHCTISNRWYSGIHNRGTLTLDNSTVSDNNGAGPGGGVFNDYPGHMTISNSTISGNIYGNGKR
jgi:hypothetical protein